VELEHALDPLDPFVGTEGEGLPSERPHIVVEGDDTKVELEAAGPDQMDDSVQRCVDVPDLEPSDGRLRGSRETSETTL
jgi:hypothetical protein